MFYFMLSKINGTLYSVFRVTNDGNFNFLSICLPYSFSPFLYPDKSKHDPCFLMPNPSLPIILFYFQLYHFAILILETKLFIPFPISYVCFVCCKLRWCKSHCLCPFPFKCDLFSLFLQNIFAHVLIIFRSLFPQI